MANVERSIAEKAVEFSKKVDKYLIAAGAGIYILLSPTIGAALILGSVLTIIPADMISRWLEKKRVGKK